MSICSTRLNSIYNRANQGNHERVQVQQKKKKKVEDEGFQDRDLGEIQELTDNTKQELIGMLPKQTMRKMTQKQQCQKTD